MAKIKRKSEQEDDARYPLSLLSIFGAFQDQPCAMVRWILQRATEDREAVAPQREKVV